MAPPDLDEIPGQAELIGELEAGAFHLGCCDDDFRSRDIVLFGGIVDGVEYCLHALAILGEFGFLHRLELVFLFLNFLLVDFDQLFRASSCHIENPLIMNASGGEYKKRFGRYLIIANAILEGESNPGKRRN